MTKTLAFFLVASCIVLLAARSIASAADMPTSRVSFDKAWLFARFGPMPDGTVKEEPWGLESVDVHDSLWRVLDVPHDWGIEGPFRQDLSSSTGKLPWAGIGWYRKHFRVEAGEKGRRYFVDFDGAMAHAKIWLNGDYIGEWPYGYASFRLELTPRIAFGRENILAVRLENPMSSSRWYPGSGIYRNVWLVTTPAVHVAHRGVTVTSVVEANGNASLRVRTEIDNQDTARSDVTAAVEIIDCTNGAVVLRLAERKVAIAPGTTAEAVTEGSLASPRLWDVDSPRLYAARTTLRGGGGVLDTATVVFGIRTAVFTADSGFELNGRRVRINGVCNHHDLGPLGSAVNRSALMRQIRILREMGCNAIRTSHNPPAPELLDLCDSMGMLVLDEAFDCWIQGKTPNDYSTLYQAWHERDIRSFVRRDRNHPCVIAWSAGNEVWEQNNDAVIRQLRAIFKSEDPTRPVTSACNYRGAGFDGFQDAVDVFGYNYQYDSYARFRDSNRTKPIFGTETSSCVSTYGEYFFPVSDDKSQGFRNMQVSSYDLYAPPWAHIPDVEFEGLDRNPFVAGEFVWTGFDYLGEPTPYGEDVYPSRSSYFGIVDLCGFRKDRFYLYQARWRPDFPMAHILPHWNWPDRIGAVTPVHVYTSGDEAELFLNGRSLGRKVKEAYHYRLRWDDVKYEPGELKVVAYRNGKRWAEETMVTTGPAQSVQLTVDRTVIAADGADLAYVTARIVDAGGRMVPTAFDTVKFTLAGPGSLAATGNGDPTDHGSFQSSSCRAFHGQCLLIVRPAEGKPGIITVRAASGHLTTGALTITTHP